MSKSDVKQENDSRDKSVSAEGQSVHGPGKLIPVYVMGKQYMVPETLTIMKAMEYAGFKFIRGCGCRGGICGACPTVSSWALVGQG